MSLVITNQEDLNRANIHVAWHFAHTMTTEEFSELCRVTTDALRRAGRAGQPDRVGQLEGQR